jgi:hypothetical protein
MFLYIQKLVRGASAPPETPLSVAGGSFFPCFSEPLRKDQETYGSDKSTRILTSLLARSVLVPFRFYVLMYPEAVGCRGKIPCFLVSRANLRKEP